MTAAPVSYWVMRKRLAALEESQAFNLAAVRTLDPGLVQCRTILLPPDGLRSETGQAFWAAAEDGDVVRLLELGELPAKQDPTTPLRYFLHGIQRRQHNITIMDAALQQLGDLLTAIARDDSDYPALGRLVAQIPLGDPIGCTCPPGKDHWHPNGDRFDLVAYDILDANGLRWLVQSELNLRANEGAGPEVAAWAELLRNDHPYATWEG